MLLGGTYIVVSFDGRKWGGEIEVRVVLFAGRRSNRKTAAGAAGVLGVDMVQTSCYRQVLYSLHHFILVGASW